MRNSLKGEAEPLIERAILQARQEADLLYNLVVNANVAVIENGVQPEREYILSLVLIAAEWYGKPTEQSIEALRLAVLMFLESAIVLEAAIAQDRMRCGQICQLAKGSAERRHIGGAGVLTEQV